MCVKEWTFESGKEVEHLSENTCSLEFEGITLRSRDPITGKFSRRPYYEEGEVVLPNYEASALKELIGIDMDYRLNDGNVEFNVSNDGGTTWLYHDGANWVASAGWNSWQELDENVSTFPFITQKKQFRLKIKLSPGSGNASRPFLKNLRLFCDFRYKMADDCLRTFKHFIEDNMKILNKEEGLVDAVDIFDISKVTSVIDDGEIEVYNETNDPAHTIDLFSSYQYVDIGGGDMRQRVTFTSVQTGEMHIKFNCKVPVHIATSAEYQVSDNPAYILTVMDSHEDRALKDFAFEWLFKFKDKKVLKRRKAQWYRLSIQVTAFSSLKRLTEVMGNTIDDLFVWGGVPYGDDMIGVMSEATGLAFPIIDFPSMTNADEIGQGVFVKVGSFLTSARDWKGYSEEVPLAETVETHIGTGYDTFRTIVGTGSPYSERL